MQYHGQMSLFTSVLVAFTQLIPEHQVQILGFFKVRVKVSVILYVLRVNSYPSTGFTNGVSCFLDRHDSHWFPVSVYYHPVCLVRFVDISALL